MLGFGGIGCLQCHSCFFIGVPIPKSIASTLIVLLPKKEVCSSFADFRPISLCNFINKVFTKVLCNRLKPLLPSLISKEQSAFVHGREISDNTLLAQEMMHSMEKKVRGHNIIFKLDMMKAFTESPGTFWLNYWLNLVFIPISSPLL